ncbi:ATP-binding protein [Nocardioides sp. CPCC 206347]|uniref:ATP-binding protein n=1 Tax=unclassified Nocardioides TaxID=2615069 RepID=UPI00360BDE6C
MRRGRSEGRSFAASVERGLLLAIGLVILAKTLVWAGQFALRPSYDGEELTFALVVVCSVGLAGIDCLRGRVSSVDVVLCTIAMVAGSLMPRDTVPLSGAADSPILHLAEPMLMVIAARRRGPAVVIVLIAALFVGLRWVTGAEDGLRYGLQEAALVGGTAFGALFLVTQMRRASVRAERTLATRRVVEAERMSSAEVEATSFLHDELIPTLLAVAGLPGDPDTWSAAAIALEEIEVPAADQGLGDLVTDIRTVAVREHLEARFVVRGRRRRLPDVVQDALVGAATEALRNVARHSGQRRVHVTVVRRLGSIRVVIADPGEGFVAEHGVGLRVAVAGRVSAVGGTTHVDSVPGSGTTVTLLWRYRRLARLVGMSPDHDPVIRAVVQDPGRVALRATAVLAAGYIATAALLTLDNPIQPESYLGATAIAALVVLLTAAMTRGPLTPAHLVLAAVVPPLVLATALPSVPAAGLGGAQSWLIEFSALPALAVAWVLSRRMTLLLLVPNAVVITVVALRMHLPASDLPHLLVVQPLNALFVGIVVSVCRRAGSMVTHRDVPQASDRRVALEGLLGNFLKPVQEILLRGALGQLTSAESSRAALLAHAARDCLYLPGTEHADLRAELTALRATGAQVESRMTEYPAATRTLASALRALVGTSAVQVTISGTVDESSVVVVPGLGVDAAARVTRTLPISWQARAEPEALVLTGPPDLASVIRRGGRRLVRD